jgi:hypothetical protein
LSIDMSLKTLLQPLKAFVPDLWKLHIPILAARIKTYWLLFLLETFVHYFFVAIPTNSSLSGDPGSDGEFKETILGKCELWVIAVLNQFWVLLLKIPKIKALQYTRFGSDILFRIISYAISLEKQYFI